MYSNMKWKTGSEIYKDSEREVNMKLKNMVLLSLMLALFLGNAILVSAEVEKAQYGYAYVTKTSDLKTPYLIKQNSGEQASNLVGDVEGRRTLVSWCENNIGNRITEKRQYSTADPVYMSYTKSETGSVRLSVSTALLTFQSTGTFGYWSPDYITYY